MKKEEIISHHHTQGLSSIPKSYSPVSHAAGNKVLAISDASALSFSSLNPSNQQCSTLVENKKDNNKTSTMSRMKKLLRWVAAAKSEKGAMFLDRKVLSFRNRSTLKSVPDDDQLSFESPTISFRLDVESCSTISSAYSGISMVSASSSKIDIDQITICNNNNIISSVSSTPIHDHLCNSRKGNWITTDSEFVVLEL